MFPFIIKFTYIPLSYNYTARKSYPNFITYALTCVVTQCKITCAELYINATRKSIWITSFISWGIASIMCQCALKVNNGLWPIISDLLFRLKSITSLAWNSGHFSNQLGKKNQVVCLPFPYGPKNLKMAGSPFFFLVIKFHNASQKFRNVHFKKHSVCFQDRLHWFWANE